MPKNNTKEIYNHREKNERGDINLGGTAALTSTTNVTFSFKEIDEICKYDIENTYPTSLGSILHQTRGVPIGSPGSPTYAICICAYYEHLRHEKLTNVQINGTYYI